MESTFLYASLFTSTLPTSASEKRELSDHTNVAPPWKIVFQAMSLSLIMIVSGVLNAIVIRTIYKRSYLQTASNRFIYSMTISNALVAFIVLPFNLATCILQEWIFGVVVCNLMGFITLCALTGSIFNIALITLDRYYAIVQPLMYPLKVTSNYTNHLIVSIWILALISTLPPSFGWSRYSYQPAKSACVADWQHHISYGIFFAIMSTLFPFLLICYCYFAILQVARRSSRRVSHSNVVVEEALRTMSRRRSRRTSLLVNIRMNSPTKALRTVLITVSAIVLTWFPLVVELLGKIILGGEFVIDWLEAGALWLAYCSLIINPCIYALWNKTVRNEILGMFCARSASLQWAWRADDQIVAKRRESRHLSISGSITDVSYTATLRGRLALSTQITLTGQQTSSNDSVISGTPLESIHEMPNGVDKNMSRSARKVCLTSGQKSLVNTTADIHHQSESSAVRSAGSRRSDQGSNQDVKSDGGSSTKLSVVSVDESGSS